MSIGDDLKEANQKAEPKVDNFLRRMANLLMRTADSPYTVIIVIAVLILGIVAGAMIFK